MIVAEPFEKSTNSIKIEPKKDQAAKLAT